MLIAIGAAFVLCGAVAEAQQQAKVAKIGWLGIQRGLSGDSIQHQLRNLGYVEGKNVAFEYRFVDHKRDRLPVLANELVQLKVDVILTPGNSEALAAKKAPRQPHRFFCRRC